MNDKIIFTRCLFGAVNLILHFRMGRDSIWSDGDFVTMLSKKTWCFSCQTGELTRKLPKGNPGYEIVEDVCTKCNASKTTLMGKNYPPRIAGITDYFHGKDKK